MTQDNTMPALSTWVRQLTGELDVELVAKTAVPPKPDYVIPYAAFLRGSGTVGLCSATNRRRTHKCNVEFVFDGETRRLIDVKLINKEA